MNWLEITITTQPDRLDALVDTLGELGVSGLVINDEASLREFLGDNPNAWDYVDDSVFSGLGGVSSVCFYLEDSPGGLAELDGFRAALPGADFAVRCVADEDWLHNWRAFFHPTAVGRRLLIVPAWEPAPESTDRVILRIEPKQVFGTGTHASTQMCLEELECHGARSVLDLGCGSGILLIAALLLGAQRATGCDLAEDAAAVCLENAWLNNIDPRRVDIRTGNILSGDTLERAAGGRRFDLVFANIIADVIISLAPRVPELLAPDGVFICSGIIDGRQDAVDSALTAAGLRVTAARSRDGWHMLAARHRSHTQTTRPAAGRREAPL